MFIYIANHFINKKTKLGIAITLFSCEIYFSFVLLYNFLSKTERYNKLGQQVELYIYYYT